MRTHGRDVRFRPRPWAKILEEVQDSALWRPDYRYTKAIVSSVIDSGRADDLACSTSLLDLMIVPTPVPQPPYGLVVVRGPVSVSRAPTEGNVIIEHQSLTGHHEVLERPADEAVPLFWRFMIEKFGIEPPHRQ